MALQTSEYGSGSNCGRSLVITNKANGKSTTATVTDMCPGCKNSQSLDLSTAAFNAIGDPDTGVLEYVVLLPDSAVGSVADRVVR